MPVPYLPSSTDALVWTAPCQMEMQRVPLPALGAGDLLLEVAAVGICGSELSGYLGHSSLRVPPLIMGHEFSARIVQEAGGVLADGSTPQPGKLVTVNPLIHCGSCDLCTAGLPNLCRRRQLVGVHRAGGFATHCAVPAAQCWPLDERLNDLAGTLVEPLACAVRAVHHALLDTDGPLLILGAGTIGLFCLAVARGQGVKELVVTDRLPERLRLAEAWGATATVVSDAADLTLRAALPSGARSVIDAVGSHTTRALALQLVRPGGRLVYIGLHDEASPLASNYLVRQEVTLQGSFAYTPADFALALRLLAAGSIVPTPEWVEERPLTAGAAAFAGLLEGSITVPKIVLRPQTLF